MPPKQYRSVSIREDVYRELELFAKSKGLGSVSDAIRLLLEYRDIYSKIEELVKSFVKSSSSSASPTNSSATASNKHGKTAMDILKEQKLIIESELTGVKNRGAFFAKLEKEGAVVIETAKGRVAVLPEVWEEFKTKLVAVHDKSEDEIRDKLGKTLFKLFNFLRESGEIYYDAKEKKWLFVSEAGKKQNEE